MLTSLYLRTQNAIRDRLNTDRGATTVEILIWVVAVIGIAAVAVAAVRTYVTTKSGQIK